ncbi:Ribosome-releasing factor 2, mitochondrial [Kickxella alabastrina]|nr:Ribosome-releasing factor 2, mitochondrial [Kickxella alabastrina]
MLILALRQSALRHTQHTLSHTRRHFSCTRHFLSDLHTVRNLGIIAHIDAGKTTTTERMLHYAGFTRTLGSVDSGDTVMDYLAAERERGITIQSAAITFGWQNHQLHLIDTPGHVDFTVEVERAMRVLDGAVAIVDAVAGVQAQTRTVWRQAQKYGIPRVVFINKMDRDGADWKKAVGDLETKLGARTLVLTVPDPTAELDVKGSGSLRRWIDAVTLERMEFDLAADASGATLRRTTLCPDTHPESFAEAVRARVCLVEALSEIDHEIVDAFLDVDGTHTLVPPESVRAAIRRVTLANKACPVLLGASFRNIGVQPLLDAIVHYLPSPKDVAAPLAKGADDRVAALEEGSDGLVAFAFKVVVDRQRGPMVYVRVYRGTLDARMPLINATRNTAERAGRLLQMYADDTEEIPRIMRGHIGVILGLKQTRTGDTLVAQPKGKVRPALLQLHGIEVPPPVFFCSVEADSPQDERPLADALASLTLEDPSLHVSVDPETGQTLLQGMGELHLEVVRDRLVRDYRVNAGFGAMRVSYREMPGCRVERVFEYVREVAGRPARANVHISIAPLDGADGADGADGNRVEVRMPDVLEAPGCAPVVAGSEPFEAVRRALHSGLTNALLRGTILGFPIARAHVQVAQIEYFGEHASPPAAFRACAMQAVFQAMAASRPVLLEPIARCTVVCPESHLGAVLGDLNGARHGRVVSLEDAEASDGDAGNALKVLVAEAPLSAMVGYSSQLRSLTAGRGSFTMEVQGFGPMSTLQQQRVIKESQGIY